MAMAPRRHPRRPATWSHVEEPDQPYAIRRHADDVGFSCGEALSNLALRTPPDLHPQARPSPASSRRTRRYGTRTGSPAEPISSAADGLDDIWTQFLAQVADVHLDDVGPRVVLVAPDLIDELGLGQNLARMVHHRLQEGELPRGQLDRSPLDQRFPRKNVDGDSSVRDLRRNRLVGGAETRSDARQQFREAERLRHVVVSPCV